ncbi:MAG: hypothetical protein LIO93_10090 [Bacteroidales bacterium]|nr:hypothetical protein [Bacteroidales bacterium]
MIHYFNPGNETAILNASRYYQPATNQVKMQKELAFLPAWYASASDYVLVPGDLTPEFRESIRKLQPLASPITEKDFTDRKGTLSGEEVDLWGIAPNSIYYFEKINQAYQLHLQIPEWKEEYKQLSSRQTAHDILKQLLNSIPEINKNLLPCYFNTISDLEEHLIDSKTNQLLKSPFSSSGRGLIWLPPEKLPRSEKQIIQGMLKRQRTVSLERVLDKQLDFSLHFKIENNEIHFLGYSLFHTNKKGAYEYSILSHPVEQERIIASYIGSRLMEKVKDKLSGILLKTYGPFYNGNIGVDMLIYQSEEKYHLYPCVEINMRKSMGYLALEFEKNFLHPLSNGTFHIEFHASSKDTYDKHLEMQKQHPLIIENKRILSGYLNLCPVTPESQYSAYTNVFSVNSKQ